jgi:lipoprotein signal peptidase
LFVGCPAGNYAETGGVIPTLIALFTTLCIAIICYKIIDLETKNKWYYLGLVVIIGVTLLNIFAFIWE